MEFIRSGLTPINVSSAPPSPRPSTLYVIRHLHPKIPLAKSERFLELTQEYPHGISSQRRGFDLAFPDSPRSHWHLQGHSAGQGKCGARLTKSPKRVWRRIRGRGHWNHLEGRWWHICQISWILVSNKMNDPFKEKGIFSLAMSPPTLDSNADTPATNTWVQSIYFPFRRERSENLTKSIWCLIDSIIHLIGINLGVESLDHRHRRQTSSAQSIKSLTTLTCHQANQSFWQAAMCSSLTKKAQFQSFQSFQSYMAHQPRVSSTLLWKIPMICRFGCQRFILILRRMPMRRPFRW